MWSVRTEVAGGSAVRGSSPTPRRFARQAISVAAAFAVAFMLDHATSQRYSQVLGSIAIAISLLAVWPRARALTIPVTAYAGVWIGFNLARALGDEVPWRERWHHMVPALEARLAGGELASIHVQRALFDPLAIDRFDQLFTVVYLSFFVVPHIVAATLLVRDRARFWRYLAATALLFAIGAVSFALLPTTPPWMSPAEESGGVTLRVINHVLADAGLRAEIPADGGAMANHHSFEPNPVATIPSIHLGVTALLVPVAIGTIWRGIAVIYALAMAFSLVYLGEHYALDAMAGALVAAIAWYGSAELLKSRRGAGRLAVVRAPGVPRLRGAAQTGR
jgi:membrane-associated phospholipid phosphatase